MLRVIAVLGKISLRHPNIVCRCLSSCTGESGLVFRPLLEPTHIAKLDSPSPADFSSEVLGRDSDSGDAKLYPRIVTGLTKNWPASRKWSTIGSLLSERTAHLSVPVELGKKNVGYNIDASMTYTGETEALGAPSWQRTDIRFDLFVQLLESGRLEEEGLVAYLSQVSIDEIPPLEEDVQLPLPHTPQLAANPNLWIGSKGTYTPIHRDILGHNLLFQLLGTKHVRLYPPTQYSRLYISTDPFLRNTSLIPFDHSFDRSRWPLFGEVDEWYECIIGPGDALFMPKGWYHSVWALEKSISVNSWFL
ncbi:hypothetical protein JAAARDRAFT_34131 [Jaapia argillacea MUCL 33604]|uniref:JmjC domain-containing protein n=1 Tax=Jaapia argillacea MUCL 33604 TaxID=933084 RepID=A0A067Q6V8_9AGAM|nr:hypothetical protein JAAARDRAFT_34131 [Jaapia argillacea MUCL 33604]